MRWMTGLVTGAVALAGAAGLLAAGAPTAAAYPPGCIGKNFNESRSLGPGEAICNGNYLVRMQTNGDLVLRKISTGRACWTSGTRATNATASFKAGYITPAGHVHPYVLIDGKKIWGTNHVGDPGTNANVNGNGEFWIGYHKAGSC